MDRLGLFIAMMTWSMVSGALIIAAMSLGYIGWIPFAIAVVLGFAIGLPLARVISKRIKRQDPDWDEVRNRPDPQPDAAVEMDDGETRRRVTATGKTR
jgi:hypothetical protein